MGAPIDFRFSGGPQVGSSYPQDILCTIAPNADRYLLVVVEVHKNSPTSNADALAFTWNAVETMTQIISNQPGNSSNTYMYGLANPTPGAHHLTVNIHYATGSTWFGQISVYSLYNVTGVNTSINTQSNTPVNSLFASITPTGSGLCMVVNCIAQFDPGGPVSGNLLPNEGQFSNGGFFGDQYITAWARGSVLGPGWDWAGATAETATMSTVAINYYDDQPRPNWAKPYARFGDHIENTVPVISSDIT